MWQSQQYGSIRESHFKYIQTAITSLFPGQFWKLLLQNKWLLFTLLQDIITTYIVFPFKYLLYVVFNPFNII